MHGLPRITWFACRAHEADLQEITKHDVGPSVRDVYHEVKSTIILSGICLSETVSRVGSCTQSRELLQYYLDR